jgi:2-polyprenyl-6-hydroxyphenyl methylase/3-demethylubiquinone-9 3-methyltransferase
MKSELAARLSMLPGLNGRNASLDTPHCKVCDSRTICFDVVDFNKCGGDRYNFYRFGLSGIAVHYYRCTACQFLFTDFYDDWSPQDFARFIYNDDYAKIDPEYAAIRPKRCAEALAVHLAGAENLRILDYGSGAGIFAHDLRERGFEKCLEFDPFSSPHKPDGRFDVITCFEVMEHTPAPIETMRAISGFLDDAGCLIFSTGVQPPEIEQQRANWWYVSPRNGHISIHTEQSLRRMAEAVDLEFFPRRFGFAAMRRRQPPSAGWNAVAKRCGA